jgi:hypothetical protein
VLGKITGAGVYETAGCNLSSDGAHLHFSWIPSGCPTIIDGITWDCGGMVDCKLTGINQTYCNRKYLNTAYQSSNIAIGSTVNQSSSETDDCGGLLGQNWQIGTTSREVKILQGCLRNQGYFTWPYGNTGYFGQVTENSYKQWLSTNTSSCNILKKQSYNIGERSARVVQLQACMRAVGIFTWPYGNTGYYGPVTAEAKGRWG